MARQRPANFAEILLAIKAAITANIDTDLVKPDQVVISTNPIRPTTIGSIAIVIRPRGARTNRDSFVGGGRLATTRTRVVDVIVHLSLPLDDTASHEVWLTDASGMFALEDAIDDILDGEVLVDDSNDAIIVQPLMLIDDTDPRRGSPEWGDAVMSFEVTYEPSRTRSRY